MPNKRTIENNKNTNGKVNPCKQQYLAALLYDSIEFMHYDSVKYHLTKKSADPNFILPNKGIAPFHLIIGSAHDEFAFKVTSLILQCGGNPNVRSEEGLTPLHVAACWGKTKLLKLLLKNGADPQIRDESQRTPAHYARQEGHEECLEVLNAYIPLLSDYIGADCNDKEIESNNLNNWSVLEKILIENGDSVIEYKLDGHHCTTTSIKNDKDAAVNNNSNNNNLLIPNDRILPSLPEADTRKYISNWFKKSDQNLLDNDKFESLFTSDSSDSLIESAESSVAESDGDLTFKLYDSRYINFRKIYRKKRKIRKKDAKTPIHEDVQNNTYTITKNNVQEITPEFTKAHSRESGIMTLPQSMEIIKNFSIASQNKQLHLSPSPSPHFVTCLNKTEPDNTSDFVSCSEGSMSLMERNIFEINENLTNLNLEEKQNDEMINRIGKRSTGSDDGFISCESVSEIYKYIDKENGIILYEQRIVKAPSTKASTCSSLSSIAIPDPHDYDSETIRSELTALGYLPGPITSATKRVYLKTLYRMKKDSKIIPRYLKTQSRNRAYSLELEKTLRNPDWFNNLDDHKLLESLATCEFSNSSDKKWREGVNKSSFNYILLDSRITNNLPGKSGTLSPQTLWETFLSAIFYIGKGTRSRPYKHLYDAVTYWKCTQSTSITITKTNSPPPQNRKLNKIIDIWKDDAGVVCLHVFLNVIPVEAYTREAAMISAMKLDNLTNVISGGFYGISSTWSLKKKQMLGVYLLYKALMIFLNEGERLLYPSDIY